MRLGLAVAPALGLRVEHLGGYTDQVLGVGVNRGTARQPPGLTNVSCL